MSESWEANSELILQSIRGLADQDEKILEQVHICRMNMQKQKTVLSVVSAFLVVVVPILYLVVDSNIDARNEKIQTLQSSVGSLQSQLSSSEVKREACWDCHKSKHRIK